MATKVPKTKITKKTSAVAKKQTTKPAPAAAKKTTTPKAARPKQKPSEVINPFDKGTPRHAVAALLLKRGLHSWEELVEAAGGTLSPRTMGAVLVGLEEQGARFTKSRNVEYGVCYEFDPTAPSLAKLDGADATGEYAPREYGKKVTTKPAKKAPAKKAPKATTSKARKPVAKPTPKATAKPARKPVSAKRAARRAA